MPLAMRRSDFEAARAVESGVPPLRLPLTLPRRNPLTIRPPSFALCVVVHLLLLAGCQTPPLQVRPPQRDNEVVVYVIASGWHTGLALPARPIAGPLRLVQNDFPRANYLLFGWGERDYFEEQADCVAIQVGEAEIEIALLGSYRSDVHAATVDRIVREFRLDRS